MDPTARCGANCSVCSARQSQSNSAQPVYRDHLSAPAPRESFDGVKDSAYPINSTLITIPRLRCPALGEGSQGVKKSTKPWDSTAMSPQLRCLHCGKAPPSRERLIFFPGGYAADPSSREETSRRQYTDRPPTASASPFLQLSYSPYPQ